MSLELAPRTLGWDWYEGTIPDNVILEDEAFLETTYSFLHYRSQAPEGVRLGEGSTVYMGTMFDVGPDGQVTLGRCALVHGAWIICDSTVEIGDYALISWNVVIMDTYRACFEARARRRQLRDLSKDPRRRLLPQTEARPIRIGRNSWIGFDCCLLPGVTIGEGSIVGARSVVTGDVPAYTIVAGNPARIIRRIQDDEKPQAD
jgi:acetyltransferase-like isoleucine patch superfamily enzyme